MKRILGSEKEEIGVMKKLLATFAGMIVAFAFAASAFAQSSGNFTYSSSGNSTGCMLLSNGTFTPGQSNCVQASTGATGFVCNNTSDCLNIFGSNSGATCVAGQCVLPPANPAGCIGMGSATIKSSSGSGNVFVVRPSAEIGLLTDVTVGTKNEGGGGISSSSAEAGIDFTVSVFPLQGQQLPSLVPGAASANCTTPNGKKASCSTGTITYDARFIQISTNLFSALATQCAISAALPNGCFLTFAESTTSAHSFDWIAGGPAPSNEGGALQSGDYGIKVSWGPSSGVTASGIAEAAACVGAVNLTVDQNKLFNFNSANTTF